MTASERFELSIAGDSALNRELSQVLVESGCVVEGRAAELTNNASSDDVAGDDGSPLIVVGEKATLTAAIAKFRERFNGVGVDMHPADSKP